MRMVMPIWISWNWCIWSMRIWTGKSYAQICGSFYRIITCCALSPWMATWQNDTWFQSAEAVRRRWRQVDDQVMCVGLSGKKHAGYQLRLMCRSTNNQYLYFTTLCLGKWRDGSWNLSIRRRYKHHRTYAVTRVFMKACHGGFFVRNTYASIKRIWKGSAQTMAVHGTATRIFELGPLGALWYTYGMGRCVHVCPVKRFCRRISALEKDFIASVLWYHFTVG